MQIYWKMINELKEMNEVLMIHDPSILREWAKWCRRNRMPYRGSLQVSPYLYYAVINK